MTKPVLTLHSLKKEAVLFSQKLSSTPDAHFFGVTDGKALSFRVEQVFEEHLQKLYDFKLGSSTKGIDFPRLNIDLKVTSVKQPQSSSPFREMSQKVLGMGYGLLVLVYERDDDRQAELTTLNIRNTIYVAKEQTGDFTMTKAIRKYLKNRPDEEDVAAYLIEQLPSLDEVDANKIAEVVVRDGCEQGYLGVSNAPQWRLRYKKAIWAAEKGDVPGVERLV